MALLNLLHIDLQQWNATIYVNELILTLFSLVIVYRKTENLERSRLLCCIILKTMLTLNVMCISESHIEIKIKFLFSHFFVVPY